MRAVVQRVASAQVEVEGAPVAGIGPGLLVLVGVGRDDSEDDVRWLAYKIAHLRIFEDADGKMNLSVRDRGGAILSVPNFTLMADSRKGHRPSFTDAADPDAAAPLFTLFCDVLKGYGVAVEKGVFRARMRVRLINDGPVTVLLDSKKRF